jgi:hypothetical protein
MAIPMYYGRCFPCVFNQIVSYNGTVAVTYKYDKANAVDSSDASMCTNSCDEFAMAIYISRQCEWGWSMLTQLSLNRKEHNTLSSPVSLCCRNLLISNVAGQLVASSIRNASPFRDSALKVHQGEFLSLVSLTKDDFSIHLHMEWFDDTKGDEILTQKCLVKVSCASVHDTYVHRDKCDSAFRKLHESCSYRRNAVLKHELAKVLLGYSLNGLCFMMVLKDLRCENFVTLDHQKFRRDGQLPQLWTAFGILVQSLLLPMANEAFWSSHFYFPWPMKHFGPVTSTSHGP